MTPSLAVSVSVILIGKAVGLPESVAERVSQTGVPRCLLCVRRVIEIEIIQETA